MRPKLDYSYHYRKWHSDTAEHIALTAKYYQRILKPYLPQDKAVAVLDIGCGMGFLLLALKQLGYENLAGIDTDSAQVASCRAKGLQVKECTDSTEYLKAHTNTYDLVLAFDLLEHIPSTHQIDFVEAIAGSLRPNGKLIGTTPNANSALASRYRYLDWTHQTAFTEYSLDFLLHHGGFAPIEIVEVEYFSRPKLWWLPLPASRHWWAFRLFRSIRRLEMMAELGRPGRTVPLSLNLLAVGTKANQRT